MENKKKEIDPELNIFLGLFAESILGVHLKYFIKFIVFTENYVSKDAPYETNELKIDQGKKKNI